MTVTIGRRKLLVALGGAAAAWPLPARAQQMARLPTVGFLGAGSPATADVWVSAFTSRLRELGWIEDRNIKIEVRWAEGRSDRSAEIATELVRLKVDVIVTYSTEHTQIAKQATSIIPIVFALAADPVRSGLVSHFGASGRQSHRLVSPKCRSHRQAVRAAARDRSESASTGGPVQRQRPDLQDRDRYRSDRC